ncbi:MAG: hypothetical protein JXA92_09605 [candidate division Zixibacteria bacterium]|nr:hypothetical protein [candidate division Zixibacteria bacterium]
MPIEFSCQQCGARIIIRHLSPGETARCKNCGAGNIVPEGGVIPETAREDKPKTFPAQPPRDKNEVSAKRRSEKTAPVVLSLLSFLMLLEIVITLIMYDLHDYLGNPLQSEEYRFFIVLGFILIVTILTALVFFSVWLYRVHEELAVFYPGYPVKPAAAVIRLLVPVYNIWGFWNIFMTVIRHFRKDSDRIKQTARRLYFPFMAVFILNIAGYLTFIKYLFPSDKLSYAGLFTPEDMLFNAVALVQLILTIVIFVLIRKALKINSERVSPV